KMGRKSCNRHLFSVAASDWENSVILMLLTHILQQTFYVFECDNGVLLIGGVGISAKLCAYALNGKAFFFQQMMNGAQHCQIFFGVEPCSSPVFADLQVRKFRFPKAQL